MPDPQHTSTLLQQRDQLRSELGSISDLRPGPLREKYMRCGKPACRCQRDEDPGHGPYFVLDRHSGGRKTTASIPAARAPQTRAQIAEYKRLRRLTSELIEVSEQLCDARLAEHVPEPGKKNSRQRVRQRHRGRD